MARIRTIKPEFWTSEQIVECSPNARLLFIGLWNFCDDSGVHPFAIKRIKMQVFPGDTFTDDQVGLMLDELLRARLLRAFTVDGDRYVVVTGWHHQKIERPSYKWPRPNDSTEFDDESANVRRTVGERSPPEWKGMEGKGCNTPCSPPRGTRAGQKQPASPTNAEFELPPLPPILDSPRLRQALGDWLAYKGKLPKPRALKALVTRLERRVEAHGESAVVDALETAMGNDWKGWDFDRSFEGKTAKPASRVVTPEEFAEMQANGFSLMSGGPQQ